MIVQQLTCEHDGHVWTREPVPGRPPARCPDHEIVVSELKPREPAGRPPSEMSTDARGRAGVTHCGSWTNVASRHGYDRVVCAKPPDHLGAHEAWRGDVHAVWPVVL